MVLLAIVILDPAIIRAGKELKLSGVGSIKSLQRVTVIGLPRELLIC
jgi:hypothetical protein